MLEEQADSRDAVALRLIRVREVLGYDQKSFAEKAGLLPQTYGPYETGKRELTLTSAKLLRRTYGIPLDFLFFGKTDDLPQRIAAHL